MKGFWKWFAIILGVIILLGIISTPFVMHSVARAGFSPMGYQGDWRYEPSNRGGFDGDEPSFRGSFDGNPRLRGGYGMMPMRWGMIPFGGFMMLPFLGFSCLFALAVLGLAIYGVVALVRHSARSNVEPSPVVVAIQTEPCVKCGKPVQKDWTACPHCGQKIRRPK